MTGPSAEARSCEVWTTSREWVRFSEGFARVGEECVRTERGPCEVAKVCADLRSTTFRLYTRSTGRFPTGPAGTAYAWSDDFTRDCGTN